MFYSLSFRRKSGIPTSQRGDIKLRKIILFPQNLHHPFPSGVPPFSTLCSMWNNVPHKDMVSTRVSTLVVVSIDQMFGRDLWGVAKIIFSLKVGSGLDFESGTNFVKVDKVWLFFLFSLLVVTKRSVPHSGLQWIFRIQIILFIDDTGKERRKGRKEGREKKDGSRDERRK